MSKKLSALDLAFLALEKQSTPVSIASLALFDIPKDYKGNFTKDLFQALEAQPAKPPFNLKLSSTSSVKLPSWIEDENFDIHYHVRHSSLPSPGKLEDLLELVSRLHSRLLDRERPLWEFYLIEGVEGNKFAMYMKMHHAAIDGMGGVELMENCFTLEPQQKPNAPWASFRQQKEQAKPPSKKFLEHMNDFSKSIGEKSSLVKDLSKMIFGQSLKAVGLKSNAAPAPFTAPKSIFNVPISGARRFAVKNISLSEIKTIGKEAGATVNDIVLYLCSSAIRQYMVEKEALPKKSLIASVPVSVRQLNRTGNQITYITADLATDEIDSIQRLKRIGESTSEAKEEVNNISTDAATKFAVVAQSFVALTNQLNLTKFMPSPSNVTISNVPGPRKPLFLGQAKLNATYPLSILVDGQTLNITVVSYCDSVGFGFMACRENLPDVQKLTHYIEESLVSLKARLELKKQINY